MSADAPAYRTRTTAVELAVMSAENTSTLQVCRSCGGGAPIDVHFCPKCTKILALGRHGDYFSYFGLRRKLTIDGAELEQRFRTLSRQFHPDYFYNASPVERRASLERSSYLNDAYRTLRHPIARVEYLLQLEGMPAGGNADGGKHVPASLLEEVFALNEELDEIRELRAGGTSPDAWRPRLERARVPIEARRAAHETELQDLAARWDALIDRRADVGERRTVLEALRERMLERNYINNLLAGIERELAA
ncbi:MAG: Fe-S protein assembly co-chaperone HscB [Acidimicrobiia bacterium]|nr:Fe-S protein assembly co-chaperone HscB [Acidimicrobiia bacterium]